VVAGIATVMSLWFQNKRQYLLAVSLLTLGALLLRLVIIDLDPFLHPWDERFHCLVAKNLIDHPLVPTLRDDPLTPINFKNWPGNHVWLHKQPLFMWQMALSMKLLGKTAFAARVPSALMGAIMVVFIYGIGKNLKNRQVGYWAAFFWAFCFYSLLLALGVQTNDHNDMAFAFYVTGSFWALSEYVHKPHWKYAVLIGIFSGGAVLNKWLTGLLVFGSWSILVLIQQNWRKNLTHYLHMVLGVIVSVIVFLPWQLYIFSTFPKIAQYEFKYNRKHIFEVVEGHGGAWDYYIGDLDMYLGSNMWILLVCGLISLFLTKVHRSLGYALLAAIIVTFVFFSSIASKMHSYVFCVIPLMIVFNGLGYETIEKLLQKWRAINPWSSIIMSLIAILLIIPTLRPWALYNYYHKGESPRNFLLSNRKRRNHNLEIYKKLNEKVDKGTLILGADHFTNIHVRFHTHARALRGVPGDSVLRSLKSGDVQLAAFQNAPDSIRQDSAIQALPYQLK
jgi:4-amino-4-deoxy-L-arabinose transferase-like glycosyltransferase